MTQGTKISALALTALCLAPLAPPMFAQGRGEPRAPLVQASLVRAAKDSSGRTALLVRIEGRGLVLGAYQGTLHFDPAVVSVDSATVPTDGYRLVNANDAAKGIVRFAGFTTDGFAGTEAVRLIVRGTPLERGAFVLSLDQAGDLDGKVVPAAQLHGGSGLVLDHVAPPGRSRTPRAFEGPFAHQ